MAASSKDVKFTPEQDEGVLNDMLSRYQCALIAEHWEELTEGSVDDTTINHWVSRVHAAKNKKEFSETFFTKFFDHHKADPDFLNKLVLSDSLFILSKAKKYSSQSTSFLKWMQKHNNNAEVSLIQAVFLRVLAQEAQLYKQFLESSFPGCIKRYDAWLTKRKLVIQLIKEDDQNPKMTLPALSTMTVDDILNEPPIIRTERSGLINRSPYAESKSQYEICLIEGAQVFFADKTNFSTEHDHEMLLDDIIQNRIQHIVIMDDEQEAKERKWHSVFNLSSAMTLPVNNKYKVQSYPGNQCHISNQVTGELYKLTAYYFDVRVNKVLGVEYLELLHDIYELFVAADVPILFCDSNVMRRVLAVFVAAKEAQKGADSKDGLLKHFKEAVQNVYAPQVDITACQATFFNSPAPPPPAGDQNLSAQSVLPSSIAIKNS